jgi:hypothetical protein
MSMNRFQKSLVAGVAALAVVGSGALAHGSGGYHQGKGPGQGMMVPGQGMMGPGQGMMGPGQGMMGPGQGMMGPGQGMMGPGQGMMGGDMQVTPSRDLRAADVRHFLEHRLEMHGNDRLKVGEVEEVDDDTIVAEVVTVDDSLVERFQVDRHSGRMVPERAAATDTPAN